MLSGELFTKKHIIPESDCQDYTDKLLIIRANWLKPEYRTPENQLFLAQCGFGCDPSKMGRAVVGTFIADGEEARMERGDFIGIIADEFIPEWAKEKLKQLTLNDF